jgi:hypothetical protein
MAHLFLGPISAIFLANFKTALLAIFKAEIINVLVFKKSKYHSFAL